MPQEEPAGARRPESTNRSGACVWLTGLSGAGKTTTAREIATLMAQRGRRAVLLDGDEIRATISRDLGFSRADRDTNVLRVAAAAKEIVERGEIVLCALVSPYRGTRDRARAVVGAGFVEVFVDAPLDVCERRDPKGLYARARRGEITSLTGVDDPYEAPLSPELTLDTTAFGAGENARRVLAFLDARGFC